MSKLNKMLLLINLLNHRQEVTLETIMATCDITERTAYRYLNDISEANIPIYFDKHTRAYRLTRQQPTGVDDLRLEEAVMMAVGLKMLTRRLNDDYQRDVDGLLQRFITCQPFPLEEIMQTFQHQLDNLSKSQDFSPLMSSILINAAIRCNRRVRLTTITQGSEQLDVEIENPSLRFKNEWRLIGAGDTDAQEMPLAEIKKASIV